MGQLMQDLNVALYEKMYLIRIVEKKIQEHYHEDGMKTPMHMSMGAEAIEVGVCHTLKPEDQILGTYRSHGIYLAKTMETDKFFGEMYGKVTGTSNGKAGSMHLIAPEAGLMCTSAVVGSHIPVAVGAAFANKIAKNGKVVAVFFGDGALDEGVFWESLNLSCLMKLPMLFVCEDNGYAVHNPASKRQGYHSITSIVSQFECNVFESDTTDVEAIYKITKESLHGMEETGCPYFLHLKYYRYLEHVGVFEDFKAGYRSREEFEKWYAVDPIDLQRKKLLTKISEGEIREIEKLIEDQIQMSVANAQAAPFPDGNTLYEDLFV